MSLGSDIAPHLPFLRRFARGLLGTQAAGDAIVRLTLEKILEQPNDFVRDVDQRLNLYRVFLHTLDKSPTDEMLAEAIAPVSENDLFNQSNSLNINSLARRALLLSEIEGFSYTDIALLLQHDSDEIKHIIEAYLAKIEHGANISILIIEDEPIIAIDIESIVTEMGYRVTGIATTYLEAVAFASADPPDIVLADIVLADDSSGIDAVRDILAAKATAVIFVTAYPERLLVGDRLQPTFLITKPYQRSTVKAAIRQALALIPDADGSELLLNESPIEDMLSRHERAITSAELSTVNVSPLAGPIQAEVVGGQLRRAQGRKPLTLTGDLGTEALRILHHATAVRLVDSLKGTNLGSSFYIRLETVTAALSTPLDQANGLVLGVQVRGLRTMLIAVHEQLNEATAADLSTFITDIGDLAWMFPDYRAFVAEAESTGRVDDAGRSALNEVSRVLESQPDELVAKDMKEALAAGRINAAENADPIIELAQRRTIANVMKAYARFWKDRQIGLLDNTWKSFDKTGGGAIGASLAVILIITPMLYAISFAFPSEFASVFALAKAVRLMIP